MATLNQWPYSSGKYCPQLRVSYRELRGDRRLALVALRRAVEVAGAFRLGFLAAVFLVALRVAGFVFAFVDPLVVELFFFAGAAAYFAFRVSVLARFLAAPIAAPESAPITVPTTGTPSAVPATASCQQEALCYALPPDSFAPRSPRPATHSSGVLQGSGKRTTYCGPPSPVMCCGGLP